MPHRLVTLAFGLAALVPSSARAEGVTATISGGPRSTCRASLPGFEGASGDGVITLPGPSTGTTAEAIPQRLARGEPDGVAIMVGSARRPSRRGLEELHAAPLAAASVACSDRASGAHVGSELFERLGIAAEARMIPATPVAGIVARGEAELGVQQVAELLQVPDVTPARVLAAAVRRDTVGHLPRGVGVLSVLPRR